MRLFKPKTTVSLLHHDYIMTKNEEAEAVRHEIERIFVALNHGDFTSIGRLEELIEETCTLIKQNITLYANEQVRLEHLEEVVTRFFHTHLFDVIEDEVLDKIREGFQERLRKVLEDIEKEDANPHGNRPAGTYFRKLFFENRTLDKKTLADARQLLELHKDENETREHLYNLMMVLIRERGVMTSSLERYEKRLDKAINHFIKIVAQEFRALYDAEVDVALEEADLIKEIDVVLEKKIPKEHRKKLKDLRKKIDVFVKKEIAEFKQQAANEEHKIMKKGPEIKEN